MSVINTNISSIQAQNSLRLTQLNQSTAMERLASGVRINSAKDDAAGLAISTRMTANIRGLAAAVRNANDGISLTQTAEGSLGQIGDSLQRIRELAVQSSNTGNNASDRAAMNNEAAQLILEIDRVASNTTFNNIKLLDGTFTAQDLQVGAGNTANDRLTISIGNARSATLGVGASSSYSSTKVGTGNVTTAALTAGALSINGYQVGASVSDGVSFANADASGIAKAAAINAVSGQTGVNATVGATSIAGIAATAFTATAAGDVLINGVDIGVIPAGTAAGDRGTQTAAAVNAKSSQTGVSATVDTAGLVTLTAADGRNITVTTTLAGFGATGLGATAGAAPAASTTTTTSKLTLSSSSQAGITVGGNAGWAAAGLNITAVAATATAGAGVSSLDLTTAAGSQAALATLDKAINTITDSRASMGAYQNRLNASISNLETASLNLQASRSRIMDTDYAKESTNLAKSQIISQAATAMLAQANQSQQSVLALLK
jgi:flagellin